MSNVSKESIKEKDLLLKLQALYNAAALAPLSAADHKKLEQIGNEIYAFIDNTYDQTKPSVGE